MVARTDNDALRILLGNGDGTFRDTGDLTTGDVPQSPVIATSTGVRGNGHGGFRTPLSFPTGRQLVGEFVLRDFNDDGRPDLAGTNISDALAVILNGSRR